MSTRIVKMRTELALPSVPDFIQCQCHHQSQVFQDPTTAGTMYDTCYKLLTTLTPVMKKKNSMTHEAAAGGSALVFMEHVVYL